MTEQLLTTVQTLLRLSAWFVILFLVFLPLERFYPRHPQKIIRKGYWQDVLYYFMNGVLPKLLLVIPLSLLASFLHRYGSGALYQWAANLSMGHRLILALVVGDFGAYWGHRWSHQWPILWSFHSVHHSATEMDWLVNSKAHPFDMVFTRFCGLVPMYILGLAQPTAISTDLIPFIYMIFGNFWSFAIHANVNLRLGFFERIIASPAFHHWHHTNEDPRLVNKNYAAIFPFYDMIFGSYFLPTAKWPVSYGLLSTEKRDSAPSDIPIPASSTPIS